MRLIPSRPSQRFATALRVTVVVAAAARVVEGLGLILSQVAADEHHRYRTPQANRLGAAAAAAQLAATLLSRSPRFATRLMRGPRDSRRHQRHSLQSRRPQPTTVCQKGTSRAPTDSPACHLTVAHSNCYSTAAAFVCACNSLSVPGCARVVRGNPFETRGGVRNSTAVQGRMPEPQQQQQNYNDPSMNYEEEEEELEIPAAAQDAFDRGNAMFEEDRCEEAKDAFTEAMAANHPDVASCLTERGRCFSFLGKNDEALQDYDEAIRLDPDDDILYQNRGTQLWIMGRLEEAEVSC